MSLKLQAKPAKSAKRVSPVEEIPEEIAEEIEETPEAASYADVCADIEELRESIAGMEEVLRVVCKRLQIDVV